MWNLGAATSVWRLRTLLILFTLLSIFKPILSNSNRFLKALICVFCCHFHCLCYCFMMIPGLKQHSYSRNASGSSFLRYHELRRRYMINNCSPWTTISVWRRSRRTFRLTWRFFDDVSTASWFTFSIPTSNFSTTRRNFQSVLSLLFLFSLKSSC